MRMTGESRPMALRPSDEPATLASLACEPFMTTTVRTRFAPSPSGHLHVGGARTAMFNWAYARGRGGSFILRIEDTDQKRSSDAASLGFLKDLHWLGILWDEGPTFEGPTGSDEHVSAGGGRFGSYFQSERLEIYDRFLRQLLDQGKAYYAFDTPEQLAAARDEARKRNVPFRYDRTAATSLTKETIAAYLAEGRPAVIRIKAPAGPITIHDEVLGDATLPDGEVDDFVIRKADGFPTYHFAVVVDDQLMEVTHVLRAQEHFNNTAKHMVLQDALGFRRPIYAHLPIICNPDNSKMSKRDKDKVLRATIRERGLASPPEGTVSQETFDAWMKDKNIQLDLDDAIHMGEALDVALPEINVDDFRRSGYLPEVLCNFLALNGWSPGNDVEKFDMDFLRKTFDLNRVVKTPAKFDRAKLLAFNLDAIQAMPRDTFIDRCRRHGLLYHPEFISRLSEDQFVMLANASHERSKTLDDMFRSNRFLMLPDTELVYEDSKNVRKALTGGEPTGLAHLETLLPRLEDCKDWSATAVEAIVADYVGAHAEGNLGKVAQPLRIAISGGTVSPPIFDTLAILGKDSVIARVKRCLFVFRAVASSA